MRKREWAGENPFNESIEPGALPELNLADVDGMAFGNLSLPIVRHDDGRIYFGDRFILSATGVLIADEVTQSELWAFFAGAKKMSIALQWVIGDIFFCAENYFHLSYNQIAEKTGYTVRTVEQYIYVMRNVSIRIESLTFAHHQMVAALDDGVQRDWLEKALENEWSVRELDRQIKGDTLPATVTVLADKAHRNRMNHLWRNVERDTLDKIKPETIPAVIAWLKELEKKL